MKNKRCSNCYFGDKCESLYACDGYSPIHDLTDDEIVEMVEDGRQEFIDAWRKYMAEYSD